MWKQLLIIAFLAVFNVESENVICYYTYAARIRSGESNMPPWRINAKLCTHIIYAYIHITGVRVHSGSDLEGNKGYYLGTYRWLTDLRKTNPNLKVLLAVGGFSAGNKPFKYIASRTSRRSQFVHNVIVYLRYHKMDGIDVAWMYPSYKEKTILTLLFQDLYNGFKKEALFSGKPRLLLSGLMASERFHFYKISALQKVMDLFNVICFDLWGPWFKYTGLSSPIFQDAHARGRRKHTVDMVVNGYKRQGLPKKRMNLIFPTKVNTYYRTNIKYFGIYGHSDQRYTRRGKYTKSKGMMAYYEICDIISSSSTAEVYVSVSTRSKYLIDGRLWATFEDAETMRDKACYVRVNGIGGIGFWTLENDDFNGKFCNQGRFPLINAAVIEMNDNYIDHCFM